VTNHVTALNHQQERQKITEHHSSATTAVKENKCHWEESQSRLQTANEAKHGEIPLVTRMVLRCQVAHRPTGCSQTETESENSAEKRTSSFAVTTGAARHDGGKPDDRLICCSHKLQRYNGCHAIEVKLYSHAFLFRNLIQQSAVASYHLHSLIFVKMLYPL